MVEPEEPRMREPMRKWVAEREEEERKERRVGEETVGPSSKERAKVESGAFQILMRCDVMNDELCCSIVVGCRERERKMKRTYSSGARQWFIVHEHWFLVPDG